ncbi:MAG: hypothetical protein A3E79_10165 [Burkholderiales bacterium RIFCSPHIGHO2_12_FULL_61_11]|nr:MAG: hypothetical protein A3E79_10165 [Burkholderiales bacterium RIFCSPHIGHO2_12_FULL_61_11]
MQHLGFAESQQNPENPQRRKSGIENSVHPELPAILCGERVIRLSQNKRAAPAGSEARRLAKYQVIRLQAEYI